MALWNPQVVLDLPAHGEAGWTCAAPITAEPPSLDDASQTKSSQRCPTKLHRSAVREISRLLDEMSHMLPQEVDFDVLYQLARACLCAEQQESHQGTQEAVVIYAWAELMNAESERLHGASTNEDNLATPICRVGADVKQAGKPEGWQTGPVMFSPAPVVLRFPTPEPFVKGPKPPPVAKRRNTTPTTTAMKPSAPPFPVSFAPDPSLRSSDSESLLPTPPDSPVCPSTLHHPAPLSVGAANSALLDQSLPSGTTIDTDGSSQLSTPCLHTSDPHLHFSTNLARGHIPAPLPTSTTTIFTSGSSTALSSPLAPESYRERAGLVNLPIMRMAPIGQGPSRPSILTTSALRELEEYNRLLQETQARHTALLQQTGELVRGLEALREAQGLGGQAPGPGSQRPASHPSCQGIGSSQVTHISSSPSSPSLSGPNLSASTTAAPSHQHAASTLSLLPAGAVHMATHVQPTWTNLTASVRYTRQALKATAPNDDGIVLVVYSFLLAVLSICSWHFSQFFSIDMEEGADSTVEDTKTVEKYDPWSDDGQELVGCVDDDPERQPVDPPSGRDEAVS